jgi:hypothetical protein
LRDDGKVEFDVGAGRLGMPVLHDDAHGHTVVGPGSTTGHALSTAAHELDPGNWTYKRRAWTLVTTPPGADNDLLQRPNDVYDGNWLDDVVAAGGGANYTSRPRL